MKNNAIYRNIGVLIALLISGLALYFVPLQSKAFYFDDKVSVEKNEIIKKIDIPKIFNAFNTRFLVGLSFALNYQWCALNPPGYRFINLVIHCFNAFLVFLLIKSIFSLYPPRKPGNSYLLEWPALFGSMVFLCHPIQTEPVNFITQRFVLLGTFFYLLTVYLYVQYRVQSKKCYLYFAFGSAVAAMFCKEFVVTLPLMLALVEFYFFVSDREAIGGRCRRLIPFFLIALIVPFLLSRTPAQAIGVANIAESNSMKEGDSPSINSHIDITRANGGLSRQEYFLTELNVVCTYVRLLFIPVHQDFDYDYPISHGSGKDLLSGLFLLCLLGVAIPTYRSNRLISFGILWFFIALSVESSFIPIGHVIAEYRMYLASVGFVFLLTDLIYNRKWDPKALRIMTAAIIIGLSILTIQRNKAWKDEFSLWNDTVNKSPHKARPYYNRGLLYYQQGKYNQAIADYNKAIEINTNYADAYFNRGFTYAQLGNFDQAILNYNKAIELSPKDIDAYTNRGIIYEKQGEFAQAQLDYDSAVEANPGDPEPYINRGIFNNDQGKLSQAIADYNKAIEINPELAKAYNFRGLVYYKQGNYVQALSDYNKAIDLDPNSSEAYNNRGNVYGIQDNPTQAISDFIKAIEKDPNNAQAYSNLAVAYYSKNEYDKAWENVNKAKELGADINPDFINDLKNASTH